ncbi:AraC-like ligand-binding domain-containing protein [Paraburkholderia franconis]|uniref:AraC-like ligand-binding domain-containing protein n=1 Tax=Paraburkholderia franconis TaxID=2654983 RepID=UPI001D0F60D6|nr:hypothetical protein [Paraburkholderia franconis]
MRNPFATSKLPYSRFDTALTPPSRQFDAWREAISVIFDTRTSAPTDAGFRCSVSAYLFGDMAIGMVHTGAQHYDRSKSKIGRDSQDHYVLQFYLDGTCGSRNTRAGVSTRPGELFIVDAAQPLATTVTESDFLNLVVQGACWPRFCACPEGHTMITQMAHGKDWHEWIAMMR